MLRLPSVADGLRRLDRSSGETHRPATAVADEIAANQHDPVAQALWRAHVERALLSARKLKAGWPSPRLSLRDPMALRALVLILAVATFFAAGGERVKRVTAAFDWQGVVAPANFRIDAWVTPPVYTGRPPVMLAGLRPGETAQATRAGRGAGRQPARDPRDRQCALRRRAQGRSRGRAAGCARRSAGGQRGAPLRDQGRRLGGVARGRRQRSRLDLHRHPRPRADHRADQGSGAAGARFAAARLQDGRRLRRGRSACRLRAQGRRRAGRRKPTHPLFKAPEFPLTLPQARTRSGRGADHARPHRASVGRRQGRDDAGRARRGRQRGPQRAGRVPAAATHLRQAGGARA